MLKTILLGIIHKHTEINIMTVYVYTYMQTCYEKQNFK